MHWRFSNRTPVAWQRFMTCLLSRAAVCMTGWNRKEWERSETLMMCSVKTEETASELDCWKRWKQFRKSMKRDLKFEEGIKRRAWWTGRNSSLSESMTKRGKYIFATSWKLHRLHFSEVERCCWRSDYFHRLNRNLIVRLDSGGRFALLLAATRQWQLQIIWDFRSAAWFHWSGWFCNAIRIFIIGRKLSETGVRKSACYYFFQESTNFFKTKHVLLYYWLVQPFLSSSYKNKFVIKLISVIDDNM